MKSHLSITVIQDFLSGIGSSLDMMQAAMLVDEYLDDFERYVAGYSVEADSILLPGEYRFQSGSFRGQLMGDLTRLKAKVHAHPEMFGVVDGEVADNAKSLLDALHEEGTIPTYSFPKNVVSTYISGQYGKLEYEVSRGLDVAIGEYASGRAIVVDKQTYQIGGFYFPGSEKRKGGMLSPARAYVGDPNYLKRIMSCEQCGWFGLEAEKAESSPFCGNVNLTETLPMLRPWGFALRNAQTIQDAQLQEEYTYVQQPLYSTLADASAVNPLRGCVGTVKSNAQICQCFDRKQLGKG